MNVVTYFGYESIFFGKLSLVVLHEHLNTTGGRVQAGNGTLVTLLILTRAIEEVDNDKVLYFWKRESGIRSKKDQEPIMNRRCETHLNYNFSI